MFDPLSVVSAINSIATLRGHFHSAIKKEKMKAHDFSHESYMGIQVSAVVDDDIVSRLDKDADERGISRSRMISHVLSEYVVRGSHVDSNVEKMTIMVQERDRLISELKDRVSWLEGHIASLMTERSRLLPSPPKAGFWSRVFKGSG